MEKKLLLCAQRLADWYCRNTADDGSTPFMIYTEDRRIEPAYEWSTAFAFMGMISAYKVFGNSEYEQTAAKMLKYLKFKIKAILEVKNGLQILVKYSNLVFQVLSL